MKLWYKISDNVEYSTDFNFFNENQIGVSASGSKITFYSLLECKTFKIKMDTFGFKNNVDGLNKIKKEIHINLLAGVYGIGQLTN